MSPTPPTASAAEGSRLGRLLVLVGIVVLSFNLRPTVASVGPVLDELTTALGMSGATAGVLTSLPVLAFATVGALAPELARRVGVHRITLLSLGAVVAGLATRALTDSAWVFLTMSLLALAGMATANVLVPSLVRLHFPTRVGLLTSIYTTALAVGLTAGSSLTVPISEHFGSWRWGLFAWAVTAAVAALPWIGLVRHDRAPAPVPHAVTLRQVARTRLGWAMALLFGFQSLQAFSIFGWFAQVYRDAGFSATDAGLMLGVVTAITIPTALVIPSLASRLHDQTWLIVGLSACYPAGYIGLILAPVAGAWLWAVFVGVAMSIFPLVLTLIALRARTSEGTAALSGFAQPVGYVLASLGPLGVGVLYEATGGWTVPLSVLAVLAAGQIAAGVVVARPSYIEDKIRP